MSATTRHAKGLLVSATTVLLAAVAFIATELWTRHMAPVACGRFASEQVKIDRALELLEPCFREQTRDGEQVLVSQPPGQLPQVLPRTKAADSIRIALVGESSGFRLGIELQRLFDARTCGPRYGLLNCAQPGSAQEHVERNLDEVLGYRPDAVLLVFGHNVRFHFPMSALGLKARRLRNRSCFLSWLAPGQASAPESQRVSQARESGPQALRLDERLADLERLLHRAAQKTRSAHVPLVVSTMAANLFVPPTAYPLQSGTLRGAAYLEAIGRPAEAVQALRDGPDPNDPLIHFETGVILARAGDGQGAYRELHRALDADASIGRATGQVNKMLRRVAADEHLPLRDTERALEARAPLHLPGWETFSDTVHLLTQHIDGEAVANLGLARGALGLPADDDCDPHPFDSGSHLMFSRVLAGMLSWSTGCTPPDCPWLRGLSLAVGPWLVMDPTGTERDLAAFLDGPELGGVNEPALRAAFLEALAEGYFRAGRKEEALRLNERARASSSASSWVQKGLFHLAAGERADARAAFGHALTIDPSDRDARYPIDRMAVEDDAGGAH